MEKDNVHIKHNDCNSSRRCIVMKSKSVLITFRAQFGLLCFITFPLLTFSLGYFHYCCCDFHNKIFLFFQKWFCIVFLLLHLRERRKYKRWGKQGWRIYHQRFLVVVEGSKNVFILIRAALGLPYHRAKSSYHLVVPQCSNIG